MIFLYCQLRHLRTIARATCALMLIFSAPSAFAGRPMTVDDAAIVAPGQCQLETYAQHTDHRDQYWATPACNAGGDWELALGGAWADDTSGPRSRVTHLDRLQAKTVFKTLEANSWGVGLVLADTFRSGTGGNGDLSANVPFSVSLNDDAVLVHLNLGVLHEQAARRNDATWGTGAEFKLNDRNSLTAEVFGLQRSGSRYQFGVAHALIPDRLQIDATWGSRMTHGASEQVVTLGLVLQTGR